MFESSANCECFEPMDSMLDVGFYCEVNTEQSFHLNNNSPPCKRKKGAVSESKRKKLKVRHMLITHILPVWRYPNLNIQVRGGLNCQICL